MKMNFLKKNNAYIALSSVLVISFLIVSISMTTTLLSISEGQMSLSDQQQLDVRSLAEACVGEVLLQLAENSTMDNTINLPDGSCQLSNITNAAGIWSFDLSCVLDSFNSEFSIEVLLNETEQSISIISWKEL